MQAKLFTRLISLLVIIWASFFASCTAFAAMTLPVGYSTRLVGDLPGSVNFYGGVGDGGGNVYATGALSDGVFRITSSGVVTTLVNPGTGLSLGIAVNGNTLVFGDSSSRLYKVDLSGTPTATLLSTLSSEVNDVAFIPAGFGAFGGNLVIGGQNRIDIVNLATGSITPLTVFSGGASNDITIDFTPNGDLLAASYDEAKIYRVDVSGAKTLFANVAPLPSGIAVNQATGDVYVASEGTGILQKLDATGSSVNTFATGFPIDGGFFPTPLSFSADGTSLFYSDFGSEIMAIDRFAPTDTVAPEPTGIVIWSVMSLATIALVRRKNIRNACCTQKQPIRSGTQTT